MRSGRNLVFDVNCRQPGKLVFDPVAALRRHGGFRKIDRFWRILTRNVAKVLLDLAQGRLGIEVANQSYDCVVGCVVSAEEGCDILDRGCVQVLHRANDRVLVREVIVRQLANALESTAIGLIIDTKAALFLHRLPLVFQVLFSDHKRPHPVRLEEQTQIDLVLRHDLEVQRSLRVRGSVHRAAIVKNKEKVLPSTDFLGALEHHVLEEVGEACAAGSLVLGAHAVAHRDGVDGRVMILRDDHSQAVLETSIGELYWRNLRLGEDLRQ